MLACKPTSGSLWAEQNVILSSRGKMMGERKVAMILTLFLLTLAKQSNNPATQKYVLMICKGLTGCKNLIILEFYIMAKGCLKPYLNFLLTLFETFQENTCARKQTHNFF